ncbi:hypothetical protein E4U54_001754 [Claviceps lovelessii]|nr:hypothetical protein E4U54_001754 [Claviceps lovelessii]
MSLGIKSIWRNGFRSVAPSRQCLPQTRGARFIPSTSSSFSTSHNLNGHEVVRYHDVQDAVVAGQAPAEAGTGTALQTRAKLVHSNHRRNTFMRNAFRETSPMIRKQVEQKLKSPYVPVPRHYPTVESARSSHLASKEHARVQVGIEAIWQSFDQKIPDWTELFWLLKRMTKRRVDSNLAAVRVILPPTWELPVGHQEVEFVDATTGLATKLRVTASRKNPSILVLRGENSSLAKAADELVRVCPDVEIYRLGDVTTCNPITTQLWPSIDDSADNAGEDAAGEDAAGEDASGGGSSTSPGTKDSVWLHEEIQTHWIDRPYEQTPKPRFWTKKSFEAYITALVCGKLHSHLALKYYGQPRQDGKLIDTDGIRVRMILDAFEDPSARKCVTLSVLKLALAFMAKRGGHRASANHLFTLADEWRLPMDTEVFNIILDGYVSKRDAGFFHYSLHKMEQRCFYPNARTWLLFLSLVQRDDARRQIITAMYELGLFEDPATRRGIAQVMAGHDAHAAFHAGKTLDQFMADQAARYGDDWFTSGARHQIVKEFLRFNYGKPPVRSDAFQALMQRAHEDGTSFDMRTACLILESCIETKDWNTALWTLFHMQSHACEPTHRVYALLTSLAIVTGAPSTLGVLIFFGLLERKLRQPVRKALRAVLLRRLLSKHPVKIFPARMAWLLRYNKVSSEADALAGVEWAILHSLDGYKPLPSLAKAVDTAWRTVDMPRLRRVQQRRQRQQQQQQSATPAPTPTPETQHKQHKPDDAEIPDLAIRIFDTTGQRPRQIVHLDSAFEPESMIRRPPPLSIRQSTVSACTV